MKRMIFIVLFLAGIASANRVLDWVLAQEYNKTQLQNVTRQVVRNKLVEFVQADQMTEEQARRILGAYPVLLHKAWADWRTRRIETARGVLEAKVQEYDADATVVYDGQRSFPVVEPNSVSYIQREVFIVVVDLELER